MDYRILFQKSLFNRTYPFKMSRAWLKDSVVYGIIIWAILYFLQPFGFSMYQGNKFLVSVIFGLVYPRFTLIRPSVEVVYRLVVRPES